MKVQEQKNSLENPLYNAQCAASDARKSTPPDEVLRVFQRNTRWVIEANAGTGKTYTLEKAVAKLIANNIVPAEKILLVTFTVKAATELRARVREGLRKTRAEKLAGNESVTHIDAALSLPDALWNISTIHGFCQAALLDFSLFSRTAPQFKLMAERELALQVIEHLMRTRWLKENDTNIGNALRRLSSHEKDLKTLTEKLAEFWTNGIRSVAEGEPLRADARACFDGRVEMLDVDFTSNVDTFFREALIQLPDEIRKKREKHGLMTYNSLVSDLHDCLHGNTPSSGILLNALRQKYQICIVDEFQDTDPLQWQIFEKIFCESPAHGFVCVGDPKQSIYSFRGADLKCYHDATKSLLKGGAKFTHLAQSWRSSMQMVEEVNKILISPEFQHLNYRGKESTAARQNVGIWHDNQKTEPIDPIRIFHTDKNGGKVRKNTPLAIAREIQRLMQNPPWICVGDETEPRQLQLSDIMILTFGRTRVPNEVVQGDQADVVAALNLLRIPYWVYRHEKLFRMPEVQTLLDVFLAALQPDSEQLRNRAFLAPLVSGRAGQIWEPDVDPKHPEERPTLPAERFIKKVGELLDARRYHALLTHCRRWLAGLKTLDVLHKNNITIALEELLETSIKENLNAWQLVEKLRVWILEGDDSEEQNADSETSTRHIQGQHSIRNAVTLVTWHSAKGLEAPVTFVTGGFFRFAPSSENLELTFHRNGTGEITCSIFGECGNPETETKNESSRKTPKMPFNQDENERLQYVVLTRAAVLMYLPLATYQNATNPHGSWHATNAALKSYANTKKNLVKITPEPMQSLHMPFPEEFRVEGNPYAEAAGTEIEVFPLHESELPPSQCIIMSSYSSLKQKSAVHSGAAKRVESLSADSETDRADELTEQTDSNPEDADDTVLAGIGGKEFGIFVHALFEEIDWPKLKVGPESQSFQDEVERVLQLNALEIANRFGTASFSAVKKMFVSALNTPLIVPEVVNLPHGIWEADRVLCEVEFQLPEVFSETEAEEKRFYKGFIDVVFEHHGKLYFLDWKTDRIESSLDSNEQRLREAMNTRGYELQLYLYSLAVFRALGGNSNPHEAYEKFGGGVYMFLRLGEQGIYARRPSLQELTEKRPLHEASKAHATPAAASTHDDRSMTTAGAP